MLEELLLIKKLKVTFQSKMFKSVVLSGLNLFYNQNTTITVFEMSKWPNWFDLSAIANLLF